VTDNAALPLGRWVGFADLTFGHYREYQTGRPFGTYAASRLRSGISWLGH
jgi:hypothetical protein